MWKVRAKIAAGLLGIFAGLPAAHALLDGDPLRWWVHGAVVIASIWCLGTASDGQPSA